MGRHTNRLFRVSYLAMLTVVVGCSSGTQDTTRDTSQPASSASDETNSQAVSTSQAVSQPPDAQAEQPITQQAPAADPAPTTSPPPVATTPEANAVEADVAAAPPSSRDIVDRVDNAVVYITTQDALGQDVGAGTGCVIGDDGLVATNFHVMATAATAYVQLVDGTRFDVVGYRAIDRQHDLVILQLDEHATDLEVFALKEPAKLDQGDDVMAIGHPSGFRFTVTTGIVSAVRSADELPEQYKQVLRLADDTVWIQTNAAISGGNSGGPLLNAAGELVGVNTWVAIGQNLGFAVHVKHLIDLQAKVASEPNPLPLPDTNVITDPRVARLISDYQKEYQVLLQNVQAATTVEKQQEIVKQQSPVQLYIDKLVELSEEISGEPASVEALAWAFIISASAQVPHSINAALNRIEELGPTTPRVRELAAALAMLPGNERVVAFLRRLRREADDRELRAYATVNLASALSQLNSNRHWPEIAEALQIVVDEYPDVTSQGVPLGETYASQLFAYRHLGIGMPAANISGRDFAGELFELDEYRGRVVVLDFWADWCPHCRVMYPHERDLVEKYAEQPFALLGINGDQRPRAERVIQQGTVTWRSWVDGPQGEIAKQWQITSWPTVFVLDQQGVVRYRDVRGEALDGAIEHLLNESKLEMPADLLPSGAAWRYLDDGSDQGTAWRQPDFDDSAWPTGATPLGYGLGVESTRLSNGDDLDSRPVTTYFRHNFEVDDPAKTPRIILALDADDGAAVYLNGEEVARRRLGAGAVYNTEAFADGGNGQGPPRLFAIPGNKLKPGRNVIAAEVHQVHTMSADLHFDLTLSSRFADLVPLVSSELVVIRAHLCRLLGNLGPAANAAERAALKDLLADKDGSVRTEALIAAMLVDARGLVGKMPEAKDAAEKSYRAAWAAALNSVSWEIAEAPDRNKQQFDLAVRLAVAACALAPDQGAYRNTLAVAYYRAGNYERSLKTLQQSIQMQGMNPYDLGFVAMAHHQTGNVDKAKLAFTRLRKMIEDDKWKEDNEARRFFQEAATLLRSRP